MKPLNQAAASTFQDIRFVLTDMDETLTYRGRLAARTYEALERLQDTGIIVVPVTAAPAGWCDQMARMWPVDGVIGENGGFFFEREASSHGLRRLFWHRGEERAIVADRLARIGDRVRKTVPSAIFAEDQSFRQTSIAFARAGGAGTEADIIAALRNEGADVTVNNLWILGWLGGYDKLAMARHVLFERYGLDIDSERNAVLYVGDSTNDAPMFAFFSHTVGVSTVTEYLHQIPVPPRWISEGPGGTGFVEAAYAVIAAKRI
ncbi:HAD-IIB family hydrolase [Agrobacterium rhizogenes]|uniref:HAD-IIB family hydrolase n=1 Tax=Rhizobium rhizogenes TaxID=359 RepID=UPI001572CA79|nr:HAD-IIB family hydrolase [Rhizobium rhizogenes]NTF52914.1 HAD-IIB family hydrolase [Rhizobium rhizogenes]NTH10124.1 HAD-IIB family hydrolase [Rhizobium rhizogenes]NTH42676.1 HAD-IIB family hydrolase [Rhizobium rhizogenes]NTI06683.1 HAD-IIB family hydrolase [Rhizobium rhizogenes]NTI13488.1 HAD-IIB family hydrolase [Rhizobium rhizogenes]